ncbi:MAG: transcriptional regulator [Terriglobia bacterium]
MTGNNHREEASVEFWKPSSLAEDAFLLGEWLVDPMLNNLCNGKQQVRIEPRTMELLVFLAQHAGKTLAKERLIASVWRDAFVTDDVLTRGICGLRRVFGDNPKTPRYIETIPKRGYRLVAPVTRASDFEQEIAKPRKSLRAALLQLWASIMG